MLNELTFGVEIEVIYSGSARQLAQAIDDAGVSCREEGYNHNVSENWKVVMDSSVARGWEVVSPVLTMDKMDQVQKVCDALSQIARVDVSCGIHVHVGVRRFSENKIRNILKRFIVYEAAMDSMVPASRRNNRYSNRFTDNSTAEINRKISKIDNAYTLRDAYTAVSFAGRYHKLNLECYWRQGTVEFRQHSGTTDSKKVINWIHFCLTFVIRGAEGPRMNKIRNTEDIKGLRYLLLTNQFGKNSATPNRQAMKYFQDRAKLFAA